MRIGIIGGGPAGLFAALLARQELGAEVEVYERNPEGVTYGFGVELAGRGLAAAQQAHPDFFAAFTESARPSSGRLIAHRGASVLIDGGEGLAIGRSELLRLLTRFCREAGVTLHFGSAVRAEELSDCDLLIGADGAHSRTRDGEPAFGTSRRMLTNHLAWYGTARVFEQPSLFFKLGEHGCFWAVGYAYSAKLSTFVVECDAASWHRAKLDVLDEAGRQRFAEQLFHDELEGRPLIDNRSRWEVLPVIRSAAWHVGQTVLIGDALHSAHPTIGSGTRIAMEDAIALVDALKRSGTTEAALATFRSTREPAKMTLIEAADRSVAWYENLEARLTALDAPLLAFDFLLRTGRLDEARLVRDHPQFMARHQADWRRYVAEQL